MQEPAYIVKNGQPIPYIPIEVKNARDAYAATLHVLFKHVADFHICVVQSVSAKYGICEDDILKTIQESPGFKNMHVDPVLDPLGYLAKTPEVPVVEPIATAKPTPVARIKKVKPIAPVVAAPVVAAPSEATSSGIEPTKPIRKKIVVQKPITPLDATSCQVNADEKVKQVNDVNEGKKVNADEVRPKADEVRPKADEVRPGEDAPRKIIKKKNPCASK